ncbi:thiol-disulfide oxidoreductase [Anaerobacillus alkalidiazotrophicus]|uniref:Thiol-disulfide oxidoreductase n=1 Tax=Anaerobacillus alkalidiazotrophicus TaxID=472963 RepID=A0A1S2M3G1_9BACI|nr:thiol-disulfide oxidoreductase DCC family protein [Anaerobacillus alkalidiazotrophicus]OIJ19289.1 thiol-disulfide oxidoreductase [Anaerobacillus alkalidiazotrophicus]
MDNIILFDGICNFCNHSVRFIIKRDKNAVYKFASLQSNIGRELVSKHNIPTNIDSLILIENNQCYYQSTAALKICKHLKGAWKLLYCLLVVPRPIRNYLYHIVAKNRYKWFGQTDSCLLPSPELKKRFLT